MISAFGVDHGGPVSKARSENEKHYGRMAGITGGSGAALSGLAGGSGIVGEMERRGHDPMGFTQRSDPKKPPHHPRVRQVILARNVKAHGKMAAAAGGVGAGSLALSAAYKHKQKQELAKFDQDTKRKVGNTALGTAAAGTGYMSAKGGGAAAKDLAGYVKWSAKDAANAHMNLRGEKKGHFKLDDAQRVWSKTHRARGVKVIGVKGAGALAGAGAAGLGVAGIAEVGRHGVHNLKNRKKS